LVTTESFITIVSGNHSSGVFLSFCKDFAAPHPRPGARTQYQPCEPRRAEGCEKGVWLSRSGGWLRPRRSVSCCSAPQAAGPPGSQGAPPPPTRDPTVRGGGGRRPLGGRGVGLESSIIPSLPAPYACARGISFRGTRFTDPYQPPQGLPKNKTR